MEVGGRMRGCRGCWGLGVGSWGSSWWVGKGWGEEGGRTWVVVGSSAVETRWGPWVDGSVIGELEGCDPTMAVLDD